MSASAHLPQADPLYAQPPAERAAYATGMLLDARDFADEQTYHRGRLASAVTFIAGSGTLAGLEVAYRPGTTSAPEEIEVSPGVAIDGLGRLIEIPRPACLRLERWFDGESDRDGGDTLQSATYDDLGGFLSARALADFTLPARAVVADLYVRFVACERGLTPSFAAGPFDALNAVAPSRVRDAYELQLVPRADGLDDAFTGLPDLGPDLAGIADATARRSALQDAILAAYPARGTAGSANELPAPPGHPPDLDPTAVFLARVLVPVGPGNPPVRLETAALVDNFSRRFLPPTFLITRWLGA